MVAMRVISRMTDSVNVTVRLAASNGLSSDLAQCAADEFRGAHASSTFVDRLSHRPLCIGRRITERHQCANRVLRAGALDSARGDGTAGNLQIIQLVGEVENQLFRLLAPDARHALQRGDVFLSQCTDQPVCRERRQKTEREGGSNTFRIQYALKDASLERRRKAEQLPPIFLDDEMRV